MVGASVRDLEHDVGRCPLRAEAPPTRVTQSALAGHLAKAHLADKFRSNIGDTHGLRARKLWEEGRFIGAQGRQYRREPGQILLREAGPDPADEPQPAVLGNPEEQGTNSAGSAAFTFAPAADHCLLGVPVLVLDPRRLPSA